jgi:hypothetical protein
MAAHDRADPHGLGARHPGSARHHPAAPSGARRALSDDKTREPSPPHLALGESILILAATLRELIASYHAVTDRMFGNR